MNNLITESTLTPMQDAIYICGMFLMCAFLVTFTLGMLSNKLLVVEMIV